MSAALLPGLSIRRVAVIGAGRLGRAFALQCVRAGFDVVLEDVMPAKLRRAVDEYPELSAAEASGKLRLALTVEDAVADADVAVDFVPDELESKLEIFCLIDRMAPPRTMILSPMQATEISDLASCTYRADRCCACVFADDATLQIVPGRESGEQAVAALRAFAESFLQTSSR